MQSISAKIEFTTAPDIHSKKMIDISAFIIFTYQRSKLARTSVRTSYYITGAFVCQEIFEHLFENISAFYSERSGAKLTDLFCAKSFLSLDYLRRIW